MERGGPEIVWERRGGGGNTFYTKVSEKSKVDDL